MVLRRRGISCGVVLILVIVFLVTFAQEEGSVRVGTRLEGQSIWSPALDKLFDLNFELDSAIFDYENDIIEEDELERRIDCIERLKVEAMQVFPEVEGVVFYGLYTWLKTLDDDLDETRDAIDDITATESDVLDHLKDAKQAKDEVEDLVEQATGS